MTPDRLRGKVNFGPELLLAIEVTDANLFTETLAQCLGDVLQGGEALVPETREVNDLEVQAWPVPRVGELLSTFVDGYFIASRARGLSSRRV